VARGAAHDIVLLAGTTTEEGALSAVALPTHGNGRQFDTRSRFSFRLLV
jgi:hypothetical protein